MFDSVLTRSRIGVSLAVPACAFAMLLTGCAVNPVTGEREISFVTPQQELAIGKEHANRLRQGGTDELEIRQDAVDMGAANKGLVDPLLPAPNPSNAAFAWPRTIWRNSPPCQRQLHRRPATALSAVVAISAYYKKQRFVARRLSVQTTTETGGSRAAQAAG